MRFIGKQDEVSAVTTGIYDTRMTMMETQMDEIEVKQTQLQESMKVFFSQMKVVTNSQSLIQMGGNYTFAGSPGSLSAGSKCCTVGDDLKVSLPSPKRRPKTHSYNKELDNKDLQDPKCQGTYIKKEAMEYVKHLPFYLVHLYFIDIKR